MKENSIAGYMSLLLCVACLSCNSPEKRVEPGWELREEVSIAYTDRPGKKIQLLYSWQNIMGIDLFDTTIIEQYYSSGWLREQVHYRVENGDTLRVSREINRYDPQGNLTEKIDSVEGSLRSFDRYEYEQDKLRQSESLVIFPDYDESGEPDQADTIKTREHHYYTTEGLKYKTLVLSDYGLQQALNGTGVIDSVFLFYEYDGRGNVHRSIQILNGDTTAMSLISYDEKGRQIRRTDSSVEMGYMITEFEYDADGNQTVEIILSEQFNEGTITEYDGNNRAVLKRRYKIGGSKE